MDPLLLDIPEDIETERMIVRIARPGEGVAVNEAIRESFAELQPWMPWAQTCPTPEETESHGRRAHAKFHVREDLTYRGWLKGTDRLVVSSGLHRLDWSVPRFEIGYWVRTSMTGKGYAGEMVRALANLAFETLRAKRVEIRCDARNQRSWRVAERCGFEFEGVLRCDSRGTDGSVRDTRVYSIVGPQSS
jgi:RimJ/RimL family protein N-acetyltransferase